MINILLPSLLKICRKQCPPMLTNSHFSLLFRLKMVLQNKQRRHVAMLTVICTRGRHKNRLWIKRQGKVVCCFSVVAMSYFNLDFENNFFYNVLTSTGFESFTELTLNVFNAACNAKRLRTDFTPKVKSQFYMYVYTLQQRIRKSWQRGKSRHSFLNNC